MLCVALFLASCSMMKSEAVTNPNPTASIDLPKAVTRLAPSTLPLMTTPGAWLKPPQGPLFEPMDTIDPRNAMIYVYRPSTSWEDQELQAPSFFVNGTKVFGLKSGSYTWLELHGGPFTLIAKRPLSILFIKKIFTLDMTVNGGQVYYFRYSEDKPFNYAAEGLNPDEFLHDGPMQQVPESIALTEIAQLKLDNPGVYYEGRLFADQRWKPFDTFPKTGADPEDLGNKADTAAPASSSTGLWQRTRNWFGKLF